MIAPFTILDCRQATLYEPYTFATIVEANEWFESVIKHTIEQDQTRILIMYEDAKMLRVFSHIGEVGHGY
jgi:hypothetical protein